MENQTTERVLEVEREIVLNQDFPLFSLEATKVYDNTDYTDSRGEVVHIQQAFSSVNLSVENYSLPFQFSTQPEDLESQPGFAPFHPDISYKIDSRDFDPKQRVEKMEKLTKDGADFFSEQAPVWLEGGLGELSKLEEEGVVEIINNVPCFTSEGRRVLDRLSLLLTFFGTDVGRLQSDLSVGRFEAHFWQYFPLDVGPLASIRGVESNGRILSRAIGSVEALRVRLPDDIETLGTIQGRFVQLPQKTNR